MTCPFCGREFRIEESRSACASCPLGLPWRRVQSCGNTRCPRCGYESPLEPSWLRAWRAGSAKRRRRPRP